MSARTVYGVAEVEGFHGEPVDIEAVLDKARAEFDRQFPVGMVPQRVTVRVVVLGEAQ